MIQFTQYLHRFAQCHLNFYLCLGHNHQAAGIILKLEFLILN